MVTYERQDVLMHGAHGKVVCHVSVNTTTVDIIREIEWESGVQASLFDAPIGVDRVNTSYHVRAEGSRNFINLDKATRPDLGYRRTITFADASDIGFDATQLVCVGECWMHVMFLTDVLEQIRIWAARGNKGYPKQKAIRAFHAEAVRRTLESVRTEGQEKYSREDRSYRDDPRWDGIPVVESSSVRLWRVREDEMIKISTLYCRTWRNGYAPKAK